MVSFASLNKRGPNRLDGEAKQIVVGQNADGRLEIFYCQIVVSTPNPQEVYLSPSYPEISPGHTADETVAYKGESATPPGINRAVITSIQNVRQYAVEFLHFQSVEGYFWHYDKQLQNGDYVDTGDLPISK